VDGFRLDVANTYLHDAALSDNPAIPAAERSGYEWSHPPRMQRHINDANREENAEVLREIRAIANDYPDAFVFGEFSEEPGLLPKFVGPDVLHSGYTFDFLDDKTFAPEVFKAYYDFLTRHDHIWPCVTFSNHDSVRTVTRYGGAPAGAGGDPALAKLALSLLLCLKGTVLLYQGEELGLDEADVPSRAAIKDPMGDLYFPFFKGRDGARTPMPWAADRANLGFSEGTPWLAVSPSHRACAVDRQEADVESILAFARGALAARQEMPVLRDGEIADVAIEGRRLSFARAKGDERIVCHFNLAKDSAAVLSHEEKGELITALSPGYGGTDTTLPPLSAAVYRNR
jgi:alpha-glucosidase